MKCPRCKTEMPPAECLACGYRPQPTRLDFLTDRQAAHQGQPDWPPQANPGGHRHSHKRLMEEDE